MMKFPQTTMEMCKITITMFMFQAPRTILSSVSADKNKIKYFPVMSKEIPIKSHCFQNK